MRPFKKMLGTWTKGREIASIDKIKSPYKVAICMLLKSGTSVALVF